MPIRPVRTFGMLLALSLVLTACDPQDLMRLLDAQPVAQEAPAAAKADQRAAGANDAADTADDGSKAEDAGTEGETATGRRTERRMRWDTTDGSAAPTERSGGAGTGGDAAGLSAVEQGIYDRLNSSRRSAGLQPLALRAGIAEGARSWACQMAQSGNFRHADLGSAGVSGENIAWGQQGATGVHDAWMTSSGHRDNRMSSRWSEYGVGVCNDGSGRPYYTERFR
jgi:uncharacterized protein YkwD